MNKLILLLAIFILSSCAGPKKEYDNVETHDYILLDHTVPKHFYVDLQDKRTGQIFRHVYVSKHFNEYKELKKGGTYSLKRGYYSHEGREVEEFIDLYKTLQRALGYY